MEKEMFESIILILLLTYVTEFVKNNATVVNFEEFVKLKKSKLAVSDAVSSVRENNLP